MRTRPTVFRSRFRAFSGQQVVQRAYCRCWAAAGPDHRRVELAPQSAIKLCKRFRLKAKHTKHHSPAAGANPRKDAKRAESPELL